MKKIINVLLGKIKNAVPNECLILLIYIPYYYLFSNIIFFSLSWYTTHIIIYTIHTDIESIKYIIFIF